MILSHNTHFESVNRAFSKQSEHYDVDDEANPILKTWRAQVYNHVNRFIKPNSSMLELNAGTGIDSCYFARQGHHVHATDLSDGMVKILQEKSADASLQGRLTYQQCSFENLAQVESKKFDYIFSNFGGLNCTYDLNRVTKHFPSLLKSGGYVTLVIMPPVCLWEILSLLKGNKLAFRRFQKNGTKSNLEGEHFQTHYYSLGAIRKAMGVQFRLVRSEGLGALSPPPSKPDFPSMHPLIYNGLVKVDSALRNSFPFNRWADHLIVTHQYSL